MENELETSLRERAGKGVKDDASNINLLRHMACEKRTHLQQVCIKFWQTQITNLLFCDEYSGTMIPNKEHIVQNIINLYLESKPAGNVDVYRRQLRCFDWKVAGPQACEIAKHVLSKMARPLPAPMLVWRQTVAPGVTHYKKGLRSCSLVLPTYDDPYFGVKYRKDALYFFKSKWEVTLEKGTRVLPLGDENELLLVDARLIAWNLAHKTAICGPHGGCQAMFSCPPMRL